MTFSKQFRRHSSLRLSFVTATCAVVRRLAEVLGLKLHEIYLLANPRAVALLEPKGVSSRQSAWEQFRQDKLLQRLHNVTSDEIEMLAAADAAVKSPRTRWVILVSIRNAAESTSPVDPNARISAKCGDFADSPQRVANLVEGLLERVEFEL